MREGKSHTQQSLQYICDSVDATLLDESGVVLGVSPFAASLFGTTPKDMTGRLWYEALDDFAGKHYQHPGESLRSGIEVMLGVVADQGVFIQSVWLVDPDGYALRLTVCARRCPAGILVTTSPLDESERFRILRYDWETEEIHTDKTTIAWEDIEIADHLLAGTSTEKTAEILGIPEGRVRYRVRRVIAMRNSEGVHNISDLRREIWNSVSSEVLPSRPAMVRGMSRNFNIKRSEPVSR